VGYLGTSMVYLRFHYQARSSLSMPIGARLLAFCPFSLLVKFTRTPLSNSEIIEGPSVSRANAMRGVVTWS
jgi:hypothetical protein